MTSLIRFEKGREEAELRPGGKAAAREAGSRRKSAASQPEEVESGLEQLSGEPSGRGVSSAPGRREQTEGRLSLLLPASPTSGTHCFEDGDPDGRKHGCALSLTTHGAGGSSAPPDPQIPFAVWNSE